MIIKLKMQFAETEDFILYCYFNGIRIITTVYKDGVLGSYYFVYTEGTEEIYKELNYNYQVEKIINKQ